MEEFYSEKEQLRVELQPLEPKYRDWKRATG